MLFVSEPSELSTKMDTFTSEELTHKRATWCLGNLVSFILVPSPRKGCGVTPEGAGTIYWSHRVHHCSENRGMIPGPRLFYLLTPCLATFMVTSHSDSLIKKTLWVFWADVFFESLKDSEPRTDGIIILPWATVFAIDKAGLILDYPD